MAQFCLIHCLLILCQFLSTDLNVVWQWIASALHITRQLSSQIPRQCFMPGFMSYALLVLLQVLAREVKALRKQLEVEKQQAATKEAEHAARESEQAAAASEAEPAAASSVAAAAEAQPAAAVSASDKHTAVPTAAHEPTGADEQAASGSLAATPAASSSAVEVASTAAVSYTQLLQEVAALRQRLHDSSIEVVAGKHLAMVHFRK